MEENRDDRRRSASKYILAIYLFFVGFSVAAFFAVTELENDDIVRDTQFVRGVLTFLFLAVWTLICYRLFRINIRIFDRRSEVFDAREADHAAAARAAELREQFMANMSHEIRTPLNAIIGFGGLLRSRELGERERELASNIHLASENLLNIVNDVLDFSKIEAGMLVLERTSFDPSGLFESVLQLFSEKAASKKLRLERRISPDLPPKLLGDPTRLTQIAVNLLSNAIKFTEKGSVELAVFSSQKAGRALLRIDVRDSGVGIPSDQIERIFERFTQSDEQTTRIFGGTGLGLSIVKRLVEAMQGRVWVKCEVGKGSLFSVELPFELEKELLLRPILEKNAPSKSQNERLGQLRLLVAEDNAMNRRVVELLFEAWGFQYSMAQNGREALEILAQNPTAFDLVLMDIQMPEMDGYEAARRIREQLKNAVPIVAMTAHALAGEREKCLRAGMDDYVAKPFREQELRDLIARLAQKSGPEALEMDRNYLRETTLGDLENQRELAQIFVDQAPKDFENVAAALAANDFLAAEKAAHAMKSTVGYMGFSKNLGQKLTEIERGCADRLPPERLLSALEELSAMLEKALELVAAEFLEK